MSQKDQWPNNILNSDFEPYQNDTNIVEMNIKDKLADTGETIAYELFKHNDDNIYPSIQLIIVKYFSNKPQMNDIWK